MKRFILAAALTVIGVAAFETRADAQVVGYNYRTYVPYTGSVVGGRMNYTPFGAYNTASFYNPVYGYGGQSMGYTDAFGNVYGAMSKYNPYTGLGYTSGYYNPGLYPYGGYRYGYYWRGW